MMNQSVTLLLCVVVLFVASTGATNSTQASSREGKLLPVFSVVSFANDKCASSGTRNGTCYTTSECTNKGGSASGSCAQGFGVCCVFELSCGDSASENNTYLVQASATTISSPCTYTICKSSSNICRIRFDFTTFVISDPYKGTAVAVAGTPTLNGGSIGQCATDQFSITGAPGTPVICGTNTGYHMVVDASDSCHIANFLIGSNSAARSWDIFVTQYNCGEGDYSPAGPPGCLQYYTGVTGVIQSFAFPTSITASASESYTHLANQNYKICIRRESNYCYICYTRIITGGATISNQGSFGLSISPDDAATQSGINTACISDYIEIPGATISPGTLTIVQSGRICGRFINTDSGIAAISITICTLSAPFYVGVRFDENEVTTSVAASMAEKNEQQGAPTGIIGFRLIYTQSSC